MTNASHVVEYFATLGRSKALTHKPVDVSDKDHLARSASEVWNEAITDIIVVPLGEDAPDETWEKIEFSIDGQMIPSNCSIAFRRRYHSKRSDHITKVIHL